MKIAIVGLGKMGFQMVEKLVADGFDVVALDNDANSVKRAVDVGAVAAGSPEEAVSKFENEKVIVWLMIPSAAVDSALTEWQDKLPKDSIVIDGGNSDYRLTQKRGELLATKHINYLDVGTSGGVLGAKNGFSMMVGGNVAAFEYIRPVLSSYSKPKGTFDYFGSSGSGHFVKMVHNAIEYGVMESLAEGYHVLKEGPYKELDLAKIAAVWQHGSVIESTLNGLAEEALKENPNLDNFEGIVAASGEAGWTLETADSYGIDMPVTQAAVDVRTASQNGKVSFATKLLSALRNKFGGHIEISKHE